MPTYNIPCNILWITTVLLAFAAHATASSPSAAHSDHSLRTAKHLHGPTVAPFAPPPPSDHISPASEASPEGPDASPKVSPTSSAASSASGAGSSASGPSTGSGWTQWSPGEGTITPNCRMLTIADMNGDSLNDLVCSYYGASAASVTYVQWNRGVSVTIRRFEHRNSPYGAVEIPRAASMPELLDAAAVALNSDVPFVGVRRASSFARLTHIDLVNHKSELLLTTANDEEAIRASLEHPDQSTDKSAVPPVRCTADGAAVRQSADPDPPATTAFTSPYPAGVRVKAGAQDGLFEYTVSSANNVDMGCADKRWWVDIDGDGRADWCRGVGNGGCPQMACSITRKDLG